VTVAIGLVCSDGVLVASDSMGSDIQTASKVTKVFKLDCCPIVWTAAGSVYVIEEVKQALKGIDLANTQTGGPPTVFAKPDPAGLRNKLKGTILKTMGTCYSGALASTPLPPGAIAPGFIADFLVCGYANATPWLLEFARDGQVNWHTDAGFYALGSGGPFATVAHGLMAHYLATPLSIGQRMKVAYRAIETTCEVSHSGVGPPVQIAVVDDAGARILGKEEVDAVGEQVARWKTLEVETLNMTSEDAQATAEGDLPSMGDEQPAPA
jgi:20S proteasome alpha/beta subunit